MPGSSHSHSLTRNLSLTHHYYSFTRYPIHSHLSFLFSHIPSLAYSPAHSYIYNFIHSFTRFHWLTHSFTSFLIPSLLLALSLLPSLNKNLLLHSHSHPFTFKSYLLTCSYPYLLSLTDSLPMHCVMTLEDTRLAYIQVFVSCWYVPTEDVNVFAWKSVLFCNTVTLTKHWTWNWMRGILVHFPHVKNNRIEYG